ncbi:MULTISPECIES: GNAT family N-acetyltransferase [Kocuria]|jgi:RimJ/RimL family protein N-acetyltransferase|uniref:GNAT family N-acetyltransferase n=1 Tax=Kocuria gwangalliensis TaxID=501592 RepID=A0ABP8XED1_9MICC|nr:GNAT family N-acetyltransferase [Kocuria sp.]MDO5367300.1 GNAT family N-acetyltransferase [Kocuria sp.]
MTDVSEELSPGRSIRTERLVLRPFTQDELEAIADRADLAQFAQGFPTPEDQDWAHTALDAGSYFFTETMYSMFAVVDAASGQVIGMAGFVGPPIDHELEVVGSVIPGRQNEGYADEVLPYLVELAFQNPQVKAVNASVPWGNEPARKLLLKNGFSECPSDGFEATYVHPRPEMRSSN